MPKEAKARILINELLRKSGWRFFDDESGPANIVLETLVKLKKKTLDAFGDDFEKTASGYVDYLLLDDRGFPIAVLGAKPEKFDPLVGTATPKDYLKRIDPARISERDPRGWERRQLLDSYKTFGCESSEPTFRYSLIDGVREGYLINPVVVDARTEITTELLAEEGYSVMQKNEDGEWVEQTSFGKDFDFSDICQNDTKSDLPGQRAEGHVGPRSGCHVWCAHEGAQAGREAQGHTLSR